MLYTKYMLKTIKGKGCFPQYSPRMLQDKTKVPLSAFILIKFSLKLRYICPDCLQGAFHRCYLITAMTCLWSFCNYGVLRPTPFLFNLLNNFNNPHLLENPFMFMLCQERQSFEADGWRLWKQLLLSLFLSDMRWIVQMQCSKNAISVSSYDSVSAGSLLNVISRQKSWETYGQIKRKAWGKHQNSYFDRCNCLQQGCPNFFEWGPH